MAQYQEVKLMFVGLLVGAVFVAFFDWSLLVDLNLSANVTVQNRAKQMLLVGLRTWNITFLPKDELLNSLETQSSTSVREGERTPTYLQKGELLNSLGTQNGTSLQKEGRVHANLTSRTNLVNKALAKVKPNTAKVKRKAEAVDKPQIQEVSDSTLSAGNNATTDFPNWKGTRLTDPKMRPPDDPKVHRTGGPVWPPGDASSYEWSKAVMKLYKVPARKKGLKETIFALDPLRRSPCGPKCIAHCLVGQPREMVDIRGLWKSAKHRLFDAMSPVEDRVVFGALSVSEAISGAIDEGAVGYLRGNIGAVNPGKLVEPMKYMDVDRALFMDESCTSGKCISKASGIVCAAKPLGLTNLFDKRKGVVANVCDIQFRRFQTCINLVREYEKDYGMSFNWVTRHRPDVYWTRPAGPVTSLSTKYVYLHGWAACGYGGGDWFYFAARDKADIIARFADEFSCAYYLQGGILPDPCRSCLGCECSIVAWLFKNKVEVKVGPYNDCIPAKFCGGGCPPDFKPKYPHNKKTNLSGWPVVVDSSKKKAKASPKKPKKEKKRNDANVTTSVASAGLPQ